MRALARSIARVVSALVQRMRPRTDPPSSFEMLLGDHIVKTTGSVRREIS